MIAQLYVQVVRKNIAFHKRLWHFVTKAVFRLVLVNDNRRRCYRHRDRHRRRNVAHYAITFLDEHTRQMWTLDIGEQWALNKYRKQLTQFVHKMTERRKKIQYVSIRNILTIMLMFGAHCAALNFVCFSSVQLMYHLNFVIK